MLLDNQTFNYTLQNTKHNGYIEKSITNYLYGINTAEGSPAVFDNRDTRTFVFFTRPQLNLSKGNLINVPSLYNLLTTNSESIHRYVRLMLDPYLRFSTKGDDANIDSQLIDHYSAFIPVLTNTLKSLTGWPDTVLPTFTSKEGLKREQQSIADGFTEIYNSFDLDATFRNIREEPITILFRSWLTYMAKVFEGDLMPYMSMITGNEIDYNTRIYVIVMGDTDHKIKKIAATGASFPINVPDGKFFDYSDDDNNRTKNKDINIRFKCDGAIYNDNVLMDDFNKTAAMFNPKIKQLLTEGENSKHGLVKLKPEIKHIANFRGYPIIDPATNTLNWWIDETMLKERNKTI